MVAAVELSASDVSDLLDKAKEAYISGDKITAIQNIDDYTEVANWDIVDLKSEFYIGRKVKLYGTYYGISGKDSINIELRGCTFDSSLIDQILTLEKFNKYTFYGTIKTKTYGSPFLHVEVIQ